METGLLAFTLIRGLPLRRLICKQNSPENSISNATRILTHPHECCRPISVRGIRELASQYPMIVLGCAGYLLLRIHCDALRRRI